MVGGVLPRAATRSARSCGPASLSARAQSWYRCGGHFITQAKMSREISSLQGFECAGALGAAAGPAPGMAESFGASRLSLGEGQVLED